MEICISTVELIMLGGALEASQFMLALLSYRLGKERILRRRLQTKVERSQAK